MKSGLLFSALALSLGTYVHGAFYTGQMFDNQEKVFKGQYLTSSGGNAHLSLSLDGRLQADYQSIVVGGSPDRNGLAFGPTADGRIVVVRDAAQGGDYFIGDVKQSAPGQWRLTIRDNDGVMQTIGPGNLVGFASELVSLSLPNILGDFENILGGYIETGEDRMVAMYVLDSGMSAELDLFNTITDTPGFGKWSNLFSVDGDMNDYAQHGTKMGMMMKSRYDGFAIMTNLKSVKITSGTGTTFSERDFVTAMQRVAGDATSAFHNIISFSGQFRPITNVVNCAIQWAYEKGITTVAAAGNDGAYLPERNPYQFLVGSAHFPSGMNSNSAYPTDYSAYGPAVDMWSPHIWKNPGLQGSSIAVAITAGVMTRKLCLNNRLFNNPGLNMKFMRATAKTGVIQSRHPKVSASGWAGTRSPYRSTIKDFTAGIFMFGDELPRVRPNYCGQLGLGSQDWNGLINKANTAHTGKLVTMTTTFSSSCGKRFCRDA